MNAAERRSQNSPELVLCSKVTVVRAMDSRVVPNSLQGVEFGGISREVEDFDVPAMARKPVPNTSVFVVRGVVLNQINFLREKSAKNFFEEFDVSVGIENRLEMVKESGAIQFDNAEGFEGVPLPRGGDFGLGAYTRPRLVKSGVLSEAGLVFEEDRRPFAVGFFLMSGYR